MNRYLTAKDLQEKMGLSRPKVYELLNEPDCPVIRIGRSIRVTENDFDRWIKMRFGHVMPSMAPRNEMR